ncbi:MAG: hypothetical protein WC380_06730, partial [Pedobacter sp.]
WIYNAVSTALQGKGNAQRHERKKIKWINNFAFKQTAEGNNDLLKLLNRWACFSLNFNRTLIDFYPNIS